MGWGYLTKILERAFKSYQDATVWAWLEIYFAP